MKWLTEQDIVGMIHEDVWMMEALQAAKKLQLPDWWICAGFVRTKIWDTLHYYEERSPLQDIDVIYFDKNDLKETTEKRYETILKAAAPEYPWSVKNEARMHITNQIAPYISSVDAIAKFPETATSLGVRLNEKDHIVLTAPHGINDCVQLTVRPTPFFLLDKQRMGFYRKRLSQKNWQETWPKLTINET
ncbi:nucleotidyltransferase family protein [Lentibacillus sp. L22]|uniref:nucleotidyltransferase family protein n=1 Tax=Lentibacillus TaxID=175304 RepID=UPI0022B0BDEA|nr:nucleotidyltransferase family protein [Lentibacillus daqui]